VVRVEFEAHSTRENIATAVAKPLVNLVPVMIEGNKKEEAHDPYSKTTASKTKTAPLRPATCSSSDAF
jgi:hypothetical protein